MPESLVNHAAEYHEMTWMCRVSMFRQTHINIAWPFTLQICISPVPWIPVNGTTLFHKYREKESFWMKTSWKKTSKMLLTKPLTKKWGLVTSVRMVTSPEPGWSCKGRIHSLTTTWWVMMICIVIASIMTMLQGLLSPVLEGYLPYSQVYHLAWGGAGTTYCILRYDSVAWILISLSTTSQASSPSSIFEWGGAGQYQGCYL